MLKPLCLLLSLLVAACTTFAAEAPPALEPQVERHIAAIQARDLPEIEATITRSADLLLILPSGKTTRTRDEYHKFTQSLFAMKDWAMTFEQFHVQRLGDYGHALYRVTFDPDGAGAAPPQPAWLTLGFHLEGGEWRLVHDQNTRIAD